MSKTKFEVQKTTWKYWWNKIEDAILPVFAQSLWTYFKFISVLFENCFWCYFKQLFIPLAKRTVIYVQGTRFLSTWNWNGIAGFAIGFQLPEYFIPVSRDFYFTAPRGSVPSIWCSLAFSRFTSELKLLITQSVLHESPAHPQTRRERHNRFVIHFTQ